MVPRRGTLCFMSALDQLPPDQSELLRGLTDLVRASSTGAGGLDGLQVIVELSMAATALPPSATNQLLPAGGASFIEYAEAGGRVVAVCGGVDFMLGRPVDVRSSNV